MSASRTPWPRLLRRLRLGRRRGRAQDVPSVLARAWPPAKDAQCFSLRGGYHGDTFERMGVCDPVDGNALAVYRCASRTNLFARARLAAWIERLTRPTSSARRLVEGHRDELAAVVIEPVVQGAGRHVVLLGRVRPRPARALDAHDVLLVLDEIATGFGRTGT